LRLGSVFYETSAFARFSCDFLVPFCLVRTVIRFRTLVDREIVLIITIKLSALRQTRWYEYAVRFFLGGVATAATGLIAKYYGPGVGGLFLAFPAILFASATLIEKHERERKEKAGYAGLRRGKDAAALDAAGAALGSIALMAFAAVIWLSSAELGVVVLPLALIVWTVVSFTCWRFRRQLRAAMVL
jgi:hypothetical protein